MNRFPLIFGVFLLISVKITARTAEIPPVNPYQNEFNQAYQLYPEIPRGVLEAVAFTNTRFTMLSGNEEASCVGMPRAYGVMGYMADSSGWFRNTLSLISDYTELSEDQLISDASANINAYAFAFSLNMGEGEDQSILARDLRFVAVLSMLTEIPEGNTLQTRFAHNAFLYSVLSFMNDERYAAAYGFPQWNFNLPEIFGNENYKVLSAPSVRISRDGVEDGNGNSFRSGDGNSVQSADYAPALWNPAASCNYSSRNNTAITAVTIHTVQGTYAGCISWFQNCSASVSAHYVVRSNDGQVTQMVLEANKAWHVGTENPYTVGIEHEGYVNNASWYTTAMYTSSAALTLDICQSNAIDPLRTGWWPWLPSTYYNQSSIPGSCTKVKGHQHYPNQTHNDPGPNWNWNYYYQLINTPPVATTYTTASGNFYDSGGSANAYLDDERLIWTIAPANATSVTISFSSFSVENTWDYLYIYDGPDINSPLIGYYTGTGSPGTITSSGGSLTFEFRSDCATTGNGWAASWTSTINTSSTDQVAPSTAVSVSGTWQTGDFQASFTESDNAGGSGLEKSFYQVIDYDGADWRANNTLGFFSDNFDLGTINGEWTNVTGTWTANVNGKLEQSDENQTNTNLYAPLTQNLSNKYLYNWAGKIDGTGNNRRAGLHFFCDNPTLTNRGNSYFVWFRVDQSVCEFYKVVNDVFSLEHSVPMTVNAGQWYDWKVIYDRITGEIDVYQDNVFVGSWTDATPYSNGGYISFRSGNCNWQVDNFKVYRSRLSNTPYTITVGNCASCAIRYQNTNPSTPAGRVKSIVRDSADNLSAVAYQDVNIDWTAPLPIDTVNDGIASDTDLTTSSSVLDANWSASSDPHSGLARYYYALGTTAGDSDVVAWTSNWGYDTIGLTNLNLQNGQWYYFSVRAENGAGLITQNYTSDGILVDLTTGISMITANGFSANVWPNPFEDAVNISYELYSKGKIRIVLYDVSGKEIVLQDETQNEGMHRLQFNSSNLAPGMYLLRFETEGKSHSLPLLKK